MSEFDGACQMVTALLGPEASGHLERSEKLQDQDPSESMKRTRQQLVDEFSEEMNQAVSCERLIPPSGRELRFTNLVETYPPCIVALSGLKTISLRELKVNTHHRGRFIILKTFCEPKRMDSIMSAVEDEHGDVDRVALYNFSISKSSDRILPKNATVAVKEPYYAPTTNGEALIRIDHPSDLIQLRSDSSFLPFSMVSVPIPGLSPTELKEKGNAAFKKCDWQTAVDDWSTALGLNDDNEDLRQTLHRNRSQARIDLGHYELAVQDSLTAIIKGNQLSDKDKSQNAKSLYRAGRASYELRDFVAAKQYFSQALGFSSVILQL